MSILIGLLVRLGGFMLRDLFKDSNRLAKIAPQNRDPVIYDVHRHNKMVYCFELKAQSHTCGR
jgi:hypothetical protein